MRIFNIIIIINVQSSGPIDYQYLVSLLLLGDRLCYLASDRFIDLLE